jgi:hypothetical protein
VLELVEIFIDNIAPILLIAAVGFVIGRGLELDPKPVGRVIFYVLSPSLVFQSISTSAITGSELVSLIFAVIIFVATMALIAYLVTRWLGVNRLDRASVMISAFTANNGNYGLPLIELAFGPAVLARAAVVFVLITISNYGTGVFVASSGRKSIGEALMNITRVPAVYAAALGLTVNFTGAQLPPLLAGPVERVSLAAVPMMLILLGLQLAQSSTITQFRLVSVGAMMRLLVSPFVALGIALLFSFNDTAMVAFIMQASMPTAVMTIILATEYDLNRQLSLSLVMASTLLSPITLSLLIFVLRRLVPTAAI